MTRPSHRFVVADAAAADRKLRCALPVELSLTHYYGGLARLRVRAAGLPTAWKYTLSTARSCKEQAKKARRRISAPVVWWCLGGENNCGDEGQAKQKALVIRKRAVVYEGGSDSDEVQLKSQGLHAGL